MQYNKAIQMRAFLVLLARQFYGLRKAFPVAMGDCVISIAIQLVSVSFFLPALGLDTKWQIPLFLGNVIIQCFTAGHQKGLQLSCDISINKILEFHFAGPINPWLVVLAYVLCDFMYLLMITVPLTLVGMALLNGFSVAQGSLFLALVMGMLTNLFFALLFFTLGAIHAPEQYLDRVWARYCGPLLTVSALICTWYRLYQGAPRLSYVLLVNPVTYCVEGLRNAIIGDSQFISVGICIPVILANCFLLLGISVYSLRKRLDLIRVVSDKADIVT